MCNIAIIGAGISGLSLAKRFYQDGISTVIYEKEPEIGGLCRTRNRSGYIFDLSGGHVFNSKYQDVKQWTFNLLPEENWQQSKRIAKILYKNKIVDYPFELALAQLDIEETIDCFEGIITARTGQEPDNFGDWLVWFFGRPIAEKYLLPYNNKIWGYDLSKMSTEWVRGKMPIPTVRQLITSVLKRDSTEDLMPHSSYYYPRHGGIGTFVGTIADGLTGIRCGEPLHSLEFSGGKYLVNGVRYDAVINTAPLPELVGVIKSMPVEVANAIRDLKYNSIQTVLFDCPRSNDFSWVYLPDPSIKPHRIVYQGNFASDNAPNNDKSSFTVEVIGGCPLKEIVDGLKEKITLGDCLDENYTKYAYVIFDVNREMNMNVIRKYFADTGVELLGRFAEWEYYNMDICVKRAFELYKRIKYYKRL